MTLTAPWWLLLLLPWTAVAVWMLLGQREKARVPFLSLWRGPVQGARFRWSLELPPIAVLLALAAVLAAILAATRPRITVVGSAEPIVVVIDRGLTMSVRGHTHARYVEALFEAREPVIKAFQPQRGVEVMTVPGDGRRRSDIWDFSGGQALDIEPTQTDTASVLPRVVRDVLKKAEVPVLVFTDRLIGFEHHRMVQIPPPTALQNVGIVHAVARDLPMPQVMVRLRNDSDQTAAQIKLTTSLQQTRQDVQLPPAGQERDYFIDFERLGPTIEVELVVKDDLPIDNQVRLLRRKTWPVVESRGELPAEIRRILQTYAKLRPPGEASTRVVVTADAALAPEQPGVIVAPAHNTAAADMRVDEHPITADVDWPAVTRDAMTGAIPPVGWRAVVSAGNSVLVGVREAPARQVCVGFESATFPRRSDFVIFWTNVLDWVGQGGEVWEPEKPLHIIRIEPPPKTDWESKLRRVAGTLRAGMNVAPALLTLAIGLMIASIVTWQRVAGART